MNAIEKSGAELFRKRSPIAISGLGPVSSLGVGYAAFSSGIAAESTPDEADNQGFRGIKDLDVRTHVKLRTQCIGATSSMSLVASALAMEDAGWRDQPVDPLRAGFILGTAGGNGEVLREHLASRTPSPLRFVHTFLNAPAGLTCQALRLQGVHAVICSGALAGLQAIRYACHLLAAGKADRVLCGGADSLRSSRANASAEHPVTALAEGAGILALERAADAKSGPHAEVVGFGTATGQNRNSETVSRAVLRALDSAGVERSAISHAVLSTAENTPSAAYERQALLDIGIPPARWFDLAARLGQVGAASGGLSTIAGCSLLSGTAVGEHLLVMGLDSDQCIALILKGGARGNA